MHVCAAGLVAQNAAPASASPVATSSQHSAAATAAADADTTHSARPHPPTPAQFFKARHGLQVRSCTTYLTLALWAACGRGLERPFCALSFRPSFGPAGHPRPSSARWPTPTTPPHTSTEGDNSTEPTPEGVVVCPQGRAPKIRHTKSVQRSADSPALRELVNIM